MAARARPLSRSATPSRPGLRPSGLASRRAFLSSLAVAALSAGLGAGLSGAAPARAAEAAPKVVTDIPPVHSLAAMVMQGVGEPSLVVPPGASPHGYSMRPSQAKMLAEADVVFLIGPALAPWMEEAVESLAPQAVEVELMEVDGVSRLPFREEAVFEDDDHDHAEHHDDDHDHDGEEHHEHEDEHGEEHGDDHGDEHADAHGHHHEGGLDPHLWLNPDNAVLWLSVMAQTLSQVDPDHAARYQTNAKAAQARIEALTAELEAELAPLRGKPFVVLHDAYGHFEARFDLPAAAAVSMGDAARPGAKRVAQVRDLAHQLGAVCLFAEPELPSNLLDSIAGDEAKRGVLDPLGATLTPGPDLYPQLLADMGDNLVACLGD